jgi:tetratricopeptide (TPR) repeat protein
MNSIARHILLGCTLMLVGLPSKAQMGVEDGSRFGHGEDSIRCIKNLSLYREYVKQGEKGYSYGIDPWRIVFNECPTSTQNIYIDGARLYNALIAKENDPARKAELMDTLKLIYTRRIQYYKQPGSVLGREGVDLLRPEEYREDIDIVEEAYGYLKESIDILKNKSSMAVVATFFNITSIKLYQNGRLTDMELIENYDLVSDIVAYQLAQSPGDASLIRVKEATDGNFIASGAPTCTSLIQYFQPQFDAKKTDLNYLQKAVRLLGAKECEENPFYVDAAEALYALEPSAEAAFSLAKLFLVKKEYDRAVEYYNEAIAREEDASNKADYYYQLAFITNAEMNQPQLARTYALEAIKLRPDWGEPLILIGDTYAAANNCFDDDFEKATVYWAAVDKFIQAKSIDTEVSEKADERINTYQNYFPDVETIFFYSLAEGDTYTVGCWINETTKVRAK